MSANNLNAIIQQALLIQQLAQSELNTKGCTCSVINFSEVMQSLLEIAEAIQEEHLQREEQFYSLSAENQKLQSQVASLIVKNNLFKGENKNLLALVEESNSRFTDISQQLQEMQNYVEQLKGDNMRLTTNIENLEVRDQTYEDQLQNLYSQNESLKQQIYSSNPIKSQGKLAKRSENSLLSSGLSTITVKDKSNFILFSNSSERVKQKQQSRDIAKAIFEISKYPLSRSKSRCAQTQRGSTIKLNCKENEYRK